MAQVLARAARGSLPVVREALSTVSPFVARLAAAAATPDRHSFVVGGLALAEGSFARGIHVSAREAERHIRTVTINGQVFPENSVTVTPVVRDGEKEASTYLVQAGVFQGAPSIFSLSEKEIRSNGRLHHLVQAQQDRDAKTRELTDTLMRVYLGARTEQEVDKIEEGLINNFKKLDTPATREAAGILATASTVAKIRAAEENLRKGTPVETIEQQKEKAMDARLREYISAEEGRGRV